MPHEHSTDGVLRRRRTKGTSMVRPHTSRAPRLRAVTHGLGALSAAAVLAVGLAVPVNAQDAGTGQLQDLQELLNSDGGGDQAVPSVPGSPSLPDIPGLGQLGGGEQNIGDTVRAAADPFVPEGGFREQHTQAPASGVEESTNPTCAPNMFIGVPGTFEINRDDDPSKPVGLLGNFIEPLSSALGGQLSATFVNYDADSGVNGTAYQRSVNSGVKKTLATAVDVAERCEGAQIFMAGYSQGAEIAGDVATDIGQRRTPIDPGRIGGVVLFSDPKRDPNSNLIVGTAQDKPLLPQIINGAINEALKDPSIAQLRSAVDPINDLSKSLGGGDVLPQIPQSIGPGQSGGNDRSGGNAGGGLPEVGGGTGGSGTGGGLPEIGGGTGGGLPEIGGGNSGGLPEVGGGTGGWLDDSEGGNAGGGLPDTGGGLPQIGGASYESDGTLNINDGLYMLPDGASGPAVVTGDYSHPSSGGPSVVYANDAAPAQGAAVSGDEILDVLEVDLTSEEKEAFAETFRFGQCGTASLVSCLTEYLDNDKQLEIDGELTALPAEDGQSSNQFAEHLATVDGEPADLAGLAQLCLGRGSAEACGASHPSPDLEEATGENRPADATALVVTSRDVTADCDNSPRSEDCRDSVTRIDIESVTSVPSDDGLVSYWETAENASTLKTMQAYLREMPAQVAAAQQAFAGSGAELAVPNGITYLVDPATAETKDLAVPTSDASQADTVMVPPEGTEGAVGADEARSLLTQGWQLGRSDDDERSRPRAVEASYAVGGCDEMTLQDCITAHAKGSGEPESATPTGVLFGTATATEAQAGGQNTATDDREGDSAAPTRGQLPVAFTEECLTKTVSECISAAPSRGVPSLPPVDAGQDEADGPAGQSSPTTSTGTSTSSNTSTTTSGEQEREDYSTSSQSTSTMDEDAEQSGEQSTPTSSESEDGQTSTPTSTAGEVGQGPATSAPEEIGQAPTTSTESQTGTEATPQTTAPTPTRGQVAPPAQEEGPQPGEPVDVEALTIQAVSGGGLSGAREADFGELIGRVASPCVPGDIVCSLPEDSQLARSLAQLGKNVAVDVNALQGAEGPTRMGGMLAVQAVDTVLEVTGLPELKLSPETIIAIINLVAGVGLIHMGNVPAGTALVSSTITQLPTAIPEVIEQLQDIPEIIAGLPDAGANAAENLGLVTDRVGEAFDTAGLGNPTDLSNLPAMLPGLVQALVKDNTGLIEIATNPMYYTSGDKHDAFDTLDVAGDTNAIQWHQRWLAELGEQMSARD